jgi:sigma-B regulation protein RsbU (phosphoserine phosphatase)
LGALEGVCFEVGRAGLRPGSLLALFTDGVTEARNDAKQMFKEHRLTRSLRANWGQPTSGMLAGLMSDVAQFRGAHEPVDDLSVLLLKRLPTGASALPC